MQDSAAAIDCIQHNNNRFPSSLRAIPFFFSTDFFYQKSRWKREKALRQKINSRWEEIFAIGPFQWTVTWVSAFLRTEKTQCSTFKQRILFQGRPINTGGKSFFEWQTEDFTQANTLKNVPRHPRMLSWPKKEVNTIWNSAKSHGLQRCAKKPSVSCSNHGWKCVSFVFNTF